MKTRPYPVEPFLLKVDDACTVLNIGRTQFYKLVNDGLISTLKIGKRAVRVSVDELHAVPDRLRERESDMEDRRGDSE